MFFDAFEGHPVYASKPSGPDRIRYNKIHDVKSGVKLPAFDPKALSCGILHLGCGAFHRAHQAWATQRAIEAEGNTGLQWGIAAASMTRTTVPDQLRPQNGLYTALERSRKGTKAEIIGVLGEILHAPTDTPGLPARIADPRTKIVMLTVTPTGYLLEPSSGRLMARHKDIQHDLLRPTRPRSAVGTIALGLERIYAEGGRPPVIISCDNISENGRTLHDAVVNFASLRSTRLADWIDRNVRFPNTMVDRIVPTSSAADREDALRLTGMVDAAPVSMEPFLQWVIEDFPGPRPRWEAAGAQFVSDVAPYELAKLRMLNGVHMMLAYLGALAGYKTIAEAIADPLFAVCAESFMLREQGATLSMPPDKLRDYTAVLMDRLRNPAIRHDVSRIGRNGSTKMATRLMRGLQENLDAGRPAPFLVLTIAAWISWFTLRDSKARGLTVTDPRREALFALAAEAGGDPLILARKFLGQTDIFGAEAQTQESLVQDLAAALKDLRGLPFDDVLRRRLARN